MTMFDLGEYWNRFPDALRDKYKKGFAVDARSDVAFTQIERTFNEVRSGCPLTIDHVTAIFADDLPFADDWTTPDEGVLGRRMSDHNVAARIQDLPAAKY